MNKPWVSNKWIYVGGLHDAVALTIIYGSIVVGVITLILELI